MIAFRCLAGRQVERLIEAAAVLSQKGELVAARWQCETQGRATAALAVQTDLGLWCAAHQQLGGYCRRGGRFLRDRHRVER